MNKSTKLILLLIVFGTVSVLDCTGSEDWWIQWLEISERCGEVLNMKEKGLHHLMTTSFHYPGSSQDCNFTIVPGNLNDSSNWDNLAISIHQFSRAGDICTQILQVDRSIKVPDISVGEPIQPNIAEYCGWEDDPKRLTTLNLKKNFYLFLNVYLKDGNLTQPYRFSDFQIYVNLFKTPGTTCQGFKCKNGKCLDESLKCMGYDACGDGSNCPEEKVEDKGLSKEGIVGIAIGGIIVAVGCFVLTLYCCGCCCWSQNKKKYSPDVGDGAELKDGTRSELTRKDDTSVELEPLAKA